MPSGSIRQYIGGGYNIGISPCQQGRRITPCRDAPLHVRVNGPVGWYNLRPAGKPTASLSIEFSPELMKVAIHNSASM
jgi:hypothetical protein